MSVPFTAASRVAVVDNRVHDLLRQHGKALRSLAFGKWLDLELPGTGETHIERIVTRRDSYAAVVVAVHELYENGTTLAIFPIANGVRLIRLGRGTK